MRQPAPLPPALRDAPFRVAQARFRGLSRSRIDHRSLARPFHGVRTTEPPADLPARARALSTRMAPNQAFSHGTAAVLFGLPVPPSIEDERGDDRRPVLHVVTIGSDRSMRVSGTVGHRARAGRLRIVQTRGVRVIHPVDVLLTLATTLDFVALVVLADALVGSKGWATIDELRAAVHARRGARGVRLLRLVLCAVRTGSRSPGETRLRLVLARNGLPEPELNHDVRHDGRFVACVDFAYPRERLAIEYEGDVHRTDKRTFRKDITRGEQLADAGWRLVRATADDVAPRGEAEFVRRVRHRLRQGSESREGRGSREHREAGASRESSVTPASSETDGTREPRAVGHAKLVDATTKVRQDGTDILHALV